MNGDIIIEQGSLDDFLSIITASYNDFVSNKIDNIIKQFNPVTICHKYDPEINKFRYKIHVIFGKIF